MPQGSITQEQVDFLETWENVSPTTNYVIKIGPRGDEEHHAVEGPRQFTLTTQERIITQSRILEKENDPFQNGCFRPVITPEDINIDTNPNALSDEDIVNLFGASKLAWGEWLSTVDAPATLRRMLDLAVEHDEDIPYARVNQIKARLDEVGGGPRHATQKDEDTYKAMTGEGDKDARKNAGKRAMTGSSS